MELNYNRVELRGVANTLTVRAWGLMLSQLNRVLVTNPDRQLPCHFSKTILRAPSYRAAGFFMSQLSIMQLVSVQFFQHRQHSGGLGFGGNGVHHQIVATFHCRSTGDLALVLSHPGKSAAG